MPNFSTPSRRHKTLKVHISFRGSQDPLHLLIDSTGIKVEGEGEWNAREHGGSERRVWRKIHIAIDEKTLQIRAADFLSSDVGAAPMPPELLDKNPPDQEIASVAGDGSVDTPNCHDAIVAGGASAIARLAGMLNPGSQKQRGPSRAAKPCAHQRTSAGRSGEDGAGITARVASKPRCIA